MLDLPCANDGLSRLVSALGESCNIRNIPEDWLALVLSGVMYHLHPKDVDIWMLDFFESIKSWEECSPIHRIKSPK
jgi:hypothetical protein